VVVFLLISGSNNNDTDRTCCKLPSSGWQACNARCHCVAMPSTVVRLRFWLEPIINHFQCMEDKIWNPRVRCSDNQTSSTGTTRRAGAVCLITHYSTLPRARQLCWNRLLFWYDERGPSGVGTNQDYFDESGSKMQVHENKLEYPAAEPPGANLRKRYFCNQDWVL